MARRDTVDQPPADPGLPFKRRARRRLVGALVIGLVVAVTLPLVLDREPRYPRPDIRVDIPSRDAQLPVRPPGEADAPPAAQRAPVNADSARAARAEAGRAAEARATAGGSAPADPTQAAADARQQAREPMTQQLDIPADGAAQSRSSAAARADSDAARAAAAKSDAARAEAQRQEAARAEAARAEAARANAARAEAARAEAARAEAARAEAARAEAARAQAARQQAAAAAADTARQGADTQPRTYPSQNWAVQIGQFARPENARAAEARASSLGLRAYSETLQTAQGERVRVRTGPFATRAAAEEARSRLLAAGLDAALIAPEAGR
ncbi:MAG: SPOR domain-containing protein [Burkholderiaceae bacterium]|jgi:DedD protein